MRQFSRVDHRKVIVLKNMLRWSMHSPMFPRTRDDYREEMESLLQELDDESDRRFRQYDKEFEKKNAGKYRVGGDQ